MSTSFVARLLAEVVEQSEAGAAGDAVGDPQQPEVHRPQALARRVVHRLPSSKQAHTVNPVPC